MRKLAFLIILSLLITACSKTELTYTEEVIDGVRHIHNLAPVWGSETGPAGIELIFERQIGELDPIDKHFQFHQINWLARDDSGNFFIIESLNNRVLQFSPDWKFIRQIGRSGEGPGEYKLPSDITVDADGNIYVLVGESLKINKYTNKGKFIDQIKLERYAGSVNFRDDGVFQLGGGTGTQTDENTGDFFKYAFRLIDSDGDDLGTICKITGSGDKSEFGTRTVYRTTSDNNDNIYLAFSNQNRINKYSPEGDLLWTADRPIGFKPEVKKYVQESDGFTMSGVRSKSVSRWIKTDDQNRLWVTTYKSHTERDAQDRIIKRQVFVLHIFDESGIFLGEIPYPEDVAKIAGIWGDHAYFVSSDRISILVYRIIEKDPNKGD
ncbi:6-bladed beta-propeller [candidate division KSB1 bacterium]